ncbi:hypothetical protein EU557_03440 [Hymenobacter wooponensis]|uniref:Uncharacterized protein n=1 Tax=Hymenobacter wooponensis TaxID=1525360 RepID=A0A4Z0MU45_9BACT|nr:hypothetical protein EU557_03440 [Hymenobacter wooponensis]
MPTPAPVPSFEDLAQLAAGYFGPATQAQVFELSPSNGLRRSYDLPGRRVSPQNYSIYAAGRVWYIIGHPFAKYATLSERTAANSARRAANEMARAAKATKQAQAATPPLFAEFFGPAKVTAPRYTNAEQALSFETMRRQEWLTNMRSHIAREILEVRRRLAAMPEEAVARVYTQWQSQRHACGLVYLLDKLWQLQRKEVASA